MKHTENAADEPNGSLLRENFVSLVRQASDLEAVASKYGRVTSQARRSLTPCPCQRGRDQPHMPTLILNQQTQIVKCWLCLARGDVFWLVMEHERICFRDAVRLLAEEVGISEPAGVSWLMSQQRRPVATTEPDSRRSTSVLQSLEVPRELRI